MKIVKYAKVRINYKSGNSITMRFKNFVCHGNQKIEWESVVGLCEKPLFLNIDEVESVFQLGTGWTIVW